jgi:hypothetical protein
LKVSSAVAIIVVMGLVIAGIFFIFKSNPSILGASSNTQNANISSVANSNILLPGPCYLTGGTGIGPYEQCPSKYSFRSISFIVPNGANNAELKGSFSSNTSVYFYVFDIANYTTFTQNYTAAHAYYSSGYSSSNNFNFLIPSGNTYYIVFAKYESTNDVSSYTNSSITVTADLIDS